MLKISIIFRFLNFGENMNYDDFVEEHEIKSYQKLLELIQKDYPWGNFRENYIFRGLKNIKYDLLPYSLRKDSKTNELEINKFISNEEFNFFMDTDVKEVKNKDKLWDSFKHLDDDSVVVFSIDKNGNNVSTRYADFIHSFNELQFKREIYVLLKFLNYSDQLGLKIDTEPHVRRWMHNPNKFKLMNHEVWPQSEFYEIISLAQHNGLPTRALDWSYDYKVALYFAVEGILNNDESDCVVWAFNYKLFEDNYYGEENRMLLFKNHRHVVFTDEMNRVPPEEHVQITENYVYQIPFFEIYRPEYNVNSNIQAQKGLFTFINSIDYNNIVLDKPFDEIVVNELIKSEIDDKYISEMNYFKLNGFDKFRLRKDEKIFHKFIIPGNLKKDILKNLYLDGYSKKSLFPSFSSVIESIKHKVQFDEFEESSIDKINFILFMDLKHFIKIKSHEKHHVFLKNNLGDFVDKIFIFSENRIQGYFRGNEIIKISPKVHWENYKDSSVFTKNEFLNYFDDDEEGYVIRVNDFHEFKYPIKIPNFKVTSDFCQIEENAELEFLLNFQ